MFTSHPYLRASASLKSQEFRANPSEITGIAASQLEAPLSLATSRIISATYLGVIFSGRF